MSGYMCDEHQYVYEAKITALEAEVSRQRLKKGKHLDEVHVLRTEQERLLELIDDAAHDKDCDSNSFSGGYYVDIYCDCFKSKARGDGS